MFQLSSEISSAITWWLVVPFYTLSHVCTFSILHTALLSRYTLDFMLSLCQPNQYYQVSCMEASIFYIFIRNLDFSQPGSGWRFSCWFNVHTKLAIYLFRDLKLFWLFHAGVAIVSHYFKRNLPLAMGIVVSGTAIGFSASFRTCCTRWMTSAN